MNKSYTTDIIIIGAGIAGLTLAGLLAKHTQYRIIIVERSALEYKNTTEVSPRVSAVNRLSVTLWQHLGIWNEEALHASPYKHMRVWDYCDGSLSFDAPFQSDQPLGYIVQDALLQQALFAKLQTNSQVRILTLQECTEISQHNDNICLGLKEGSIHGRYLIGCDGAQSWVREQARIAVKSWEYEHTAIVAHVTTANEHHQTARQKFTTEGPLAFLPLLDKHQSSIVWSVPPERAENLMQLSDADFLKELTFTSENILGNVTQISKRLTFPLKMRHVKNYVNGNIILCADAAHTIHPMAGQGLNLAMQDVLALADVFIAVQLDANLSKSLRHYERSRKTENWQMIFVLETIKRLYQIKTPILQGVIQTGVKWIDKTHLLKNLFLKIANGGQIHLPAWMIEKNNFS